MNSLSWTGIFLGKLIQLGPVWISLVVLFVISMRDKRSLGLYGKLFDSVIGMIGFAILMFRVFTGFS